jgi:hypothetical protein
MVGREKKIGAHGRNMRALIAKIFTIPSTISVCGVTRLVKWEYRVLPIKTKVRIDRFATEKKPTIDIVQDELNVLGKDGWELVTVQNIRLEDGKLFTVSYLKRQKQ